MSPCSRPKVVTVCGSTRFRDETLTAIRELEEAGYAVFSVGSFMHADGIPYSDDEKARLDALHLSKIRMSDMVYVVNPGGYIGESTAREIRAAEALGLPVRYLVPPARPIREPVEWFSIRMEAKLRANDWKGGWRGMSHHELLGLLDLEFEELAEAIAAGSAEGIIDEAVDVANFAMMIADITQADEGEASP